MSPRLTLDEMEQAAEQLRSEGRLCVGNLSKILYLDRTTLLRQMKRCFDKSPEEWVVRFKLKWAACQLTTTQMPISWIAINCGYESPRSFCKAFKSCFAMTPVSYRKKYNNNLSGTQKMQQGDNFRH